MEVRPVQEILRKLNTRYAITVFVMAMALTVAACGGGEEDDPTQTVSPTEESTPDTTSTAAATPSASETSEPGGSQGTLAAAISNVYFMNSTPFYCPACSVTSHTGATETLLTIARGDDGELTFEPMLAESWTQSDDGTSYTDFTLREGVMFHDGYGEMTAEDVAFSFNQANPAINAESVHDTGGTINTIMEEVEVLDERTVRIHWKQFNGSTFPKYLTEFWEGIPIFSKAFFDEVGEEGMLERMVGTGPFKIDSWVQHEGIQMTAVQDHWRQTPYVQNVEIREVPEGFSRVAMLETDEIQIAGDIALKDWPDLLDKGMQAAPELMPSDSSFTFAGNYWAREVDGQPLDPNAAPGDLLFQPELADEPWIGNPFEEGCDWDDIMGNPTPQNAPCESMENARLVREALAMAIDRDALVTVLTQELGKVSWAPGIAADSPVHKDSWQIPYDADQAREILAEAGYADGGFEVSWWGGPEVGTEDTIHEAICAMWNSQLNVTCTIDQQNYSSFRPTLVQRTNTKLLFAGGSVSEPAIWPRDLEATTLTRPGGYNRGIEIPVYRETFVQMSNTTDMAELESLVTNMMDWNRHWLPWVGVYQTQTGPLYNPEAIASWEMNPEGKGVLGGMNNLEYLQLK